MLFEPQITVSLLAFFTGLYSGLMYHYRISLGTMVSFSPRYSENMYRFISDRLYYMKHTVSDHLSGNLTTAIAGPCASSEEYQYLLSVQKSGLVCTE